MSLLARQRWADDKALKGLNNSIPAPKRTSPVQLPTEAGDGRVIGVFGRVGKGEGMINLIQCECPVRMVMVLLPFLVDLR